MYTTLVVALWERQLLILMMQESKMLGVIMGMLVL